MSYGFVATVAIFAIFTAVALRPPRRPRMLGYLMSVTVNEVPLLILILFGTSTAMAVIQDELLATPIGWALFGAAGVVAGGLLHLDRRARRARTVVADALGSTIGSGSPWRSRFFPVPWKPRSVERIANLRYGAGRRQRLDLYRRRDLDGPAPTLVYLHGGGYFSGNKHREARALLHRLAERGWVCISANYRLRPRAGFSDHLDDARRAVAWARDEGTAYGTDPDTVVMAGSSAGAHLTSLCALTDTGISAAICLYGYYGRYYGHHSDEAPSSTPLGHDATDAPPFFVAHGDLDTYTPVEGARALVAHLRAVSTQPVVYAELPGAQHGFDLFRSLRFEAVVDGVEEFVGRVVRPARAGSGRNAAR